MAKGNIIPWTMQAKPTVYRDITFKSRLEAHWAHFFDTQHLLWAYETHQLRLSDGTIYLPDFYLPELGCWFEVKGTTGGSALDKPLTLWQQASETGHKVVIGTNDGHVLVLHRLDNGKVSMAGAQVRCSTCCGVWFANPSDATAAWCPHCHDVEGGNLWLAAAAAAIEADIRVSWIGGYHPFAYRNAISDA